MKGKFLLSILLIVSSLSSIGCNMEDDHVTKLSKPDDDELSSESIDEAYDNEDIQDFLEKLNSKPSEIADKLDEADSDATRILNEVSEKADELSDIINRADFEGKSEEIKDKFDEISDELDELQDNVDDAKDRKDSYDNPVNKEDLTDTLDEFQAHMDNLERAISRLGSQWRD